ncbi:MAG: hypothetical protein HYX73_03890 [Acidobacteria bacterium]|nr:hypothetical protein [Acidobacteriota bacterium]
MTTRSGKLKVLLLGSPESECAISLQERLAPHGELTVASSLAECVRLLERGFHPSAEMAPRSPAPLEQQRFSGFDAFLVGWQCYQGSWKEAVELIHHRAPELPVIVVCRTGGESEWVEVLQAGAVDMIGAPFSEEEILSALMRAVDRQTGQALMKTA